jgi:transcription elongation GreA/GreB family factor
MSRAFVKEDDQATAPITLPDRPISPHPNLVTARGLRGIERAIDGAQRQLAEASAAGDAEAAGRMARDLRYWTARHATAQLVMPAADTPTVVFGVAVTGRREDGRTVTFRIVGEDEADPAQGRIAWTAPVARSLLGSEPGEIRQLPTGALEVVAIDPTPEPDR